MATKKATEGQAHSTVTESSPSGRTKTVTFRMPSDLAEWCQGEADKLDQSFNEYVVALLQDTRGWYTAAGRDRFDIERDREALGTTRREYFQHVFSLRLQQVRDNKPGFDGPGALGEKPTRR